LQEGRHKNYINIKQDNEVIKIFNEQNPNAINAGHSAGGGRLYLANQANPVAFTNARLEWNGAPVNRTDILLANPNIITLPIVNNNSGDFVGNVLGGNASTKKEFIGSAISLPLLFTPYSAHSNYTYQEPSK